MKMALHAEPFMQGEIGEKTSTNQRRNWIGRASTF